MSQEAAPPALPLAEVYADESSQQAHRHLVLGAMIVERADAEAAIARIQATRANHRLINHEVKWGRVSNYHLDGYRAIVDAFFDLNASDKLHFHALTVDTSTFDHERYSDGDNEAGFNKLIFQLLLHKIALPYGKLYRLEAFLDHRVTHQHPSKLREMLNAVLSRDHEMPESPFRHIAFRHSNNSPLIQVCDILVGAIAYRKNLHHRRTGANAAKCALAEHIMRCAVAIPRESRSRRLSLWRFRYRGRK